MTATRLHRERLIQLEEIHVVDRPAGLLRCSFRTASTGVIITSFGSRPARRVADDARDRRQVEARRHVRAHHDQRGGAVVHAGRVAGGDRAVLLERRLQPRERFARSCPRESIRRDRRRSGRLSSAESTPAAISSLNQPSLRGVRRLAMAVDRVLVLLLARHLVASPTRARRSGPCGRRGTHPTGRRGSSSRRACRRPCAGLRATRVQEVRAVAHRLHAAGDRDVDVTQRRCPAAASITALSPDPQTLLIVSAPTRLARPPRSAACRAGAWPSAGADDVAHDAFVDGRGIDAGALDGFANSQRAELGRPEILQPAEKLAGRRSERH